MSLTTSELATIYRLNGGEEWFKARTNPDSAEKPTAVDTDVVVDAVAFQVAWFARRGYDITQANQAGGVELFQWVGIWVVGQHLWTKAEQGKYDRMDAFYVETSPIASVTDAIAAGDPDDRRHFTDTKLDACDNIRVRQTRRSMGGDF